jgi:outer membrane lipoprotein-sorting protein
MYRKSLGVCIIVAFVGALALGAEAPTTQNGLSAADVVDKNIAARGGLQAWRAVQTLSFEGKLGAGGNQRAALALPERNDKSLVTPRRRAEETQLPFLMELKRGRKVRFELQFKGKTAIQVYDGTNGWKLRPFLNRMDVEPYTVDELKMASMQSDLDGPLMDYAAKGSRVELDGVEKVEGRDSYKLKITKKSGQSLHVWIDAETFLETKVEGQPRRLDGTEHPVEVYYRDYRTVDGLKLPFVLETRVLSVAKTALGFRDTPVPPEKIVIDKVEVNPKLDDKLFSKLEMPGPPRHK